MSADAVFTALADPTRRGLVESLASSPATATDLAKGLPMTRQAVAKHLAMLAAAELVSTERRGRETRYTLRPEPLREVTRWVDAVGDEWTDRLSRLERSIRD
ncbi:MAG: metalloregulator ArsR/SmtB family transcription factor [Solirubrobacterales bacterium]